MRELPEGLLDDIKTYLDITWDDEQTNRRITGLIEDGMAYISRMVRDARERAVSAEDVAAYAAIIREEYALRYMTNPEGASDEDIQGMLDALRARKKK